MEDRELSFGKSVREQALVASARHCCVCRRYKAVYVEVHHIVPEAEGGPNDLENAIVLCFDCHAAAGHYNDSHPRGSKLTRSELRRARELWYDAVSKGLVEYTTEEQKLLCRYYLCRCFSTTNSN